MTIHLLTSLLLCGAALPELEATTLDERVVRGELVSLSADALTLRTGEGEAVLPVEQLLSATPKAVPAAAAAKTNVAVELIDGTLIWAMDYQVKSGRASVSLPGEKPLSLSSRHVRSVRFLEQDEQVAGLWRKITAGSLQGDAVVVRKGGDGKPPTLDYLEGIIQDVAPAAVQFNFDGDVVPVNRSRVRVEGLIYFHPRTQQLPQPVCRVDDAGGSRWMASRLRLDGETIRLTTPAGVDADVPLGSVAGLDFSLGKIVYLSDLEPIRSTWQPFLGAVRTSASAAEMFAVRRDTSFSGEPLRLDDQAFRKGLALHSRSELVFRLPEGFSRLQAAAGIDPSQRNYGNVRLQIHGDAKLLYDETIAGDDPPQRLELDISGAGRLTILVDYGEGLDIGDQLILGGARVIR